MVPRSLLPLLALLLIGTLLSGCPTAQPATPETTPTPLTTAPPESFPVSLSLVLSALPAAQQQGKFNITGMTLAKVWGERVDSSGLARTWILGMQGGGKAALIAYSEGQFKELDLPAALSEGELSIGAFLSPEDLFRKNLNTIVTEMNNKRVGECDLALDENSYQVTFHSGSESSTLFFNAMTGELMAAP